MLALKFNVQNNYRSYFISTLFLQDCRRIFPEYQAVFFTWLALGDMKAIINRKYFVWAYNRSFNLGMWKIVVAINRLSEHITSRACAIGIKNF